VTFTFFTVCGLTHHLKVGAHHLKVGAHHLKVGAHHLKVGTHHFFLQKSLAIQI
jgi:hypothetical protein